MKKSKWPHDKRDEKEHPRDQQRQRSSTEEPRRFSKHDSSRRREDYFEGENKSVGYQKNSHQIQKSNTSPTSDIPPRFAALNKYNSKKVDCTMNSIEKLHCLDDAIKGSTKKSDLEENYKVREGVHPLCRKKGNSYPDSKNPTFEDIFSKPIDERMKSESGFPQTDDTRTECFSTRRNSNEFTINEENPSKNDMKHMHSSNENSFPVLQKCKIFYESNQSIQYYSKHDEQSNMISHDLPKNVCTYEERPNFQSDNMCNDSQRISFLHCSAPRERNEFNILKLVDFLYYNANLMQDQALFDFSASVKTKILEVIDKFPYPEREELEILCEITDGDQSEKNQQIITTRTCRIVRNIIEKFPHILETPPPPPPSSTQILVYQTMPNLQGMTNMSYKPPFLKIVQNSEVLLRSSTDYNLMSDYNTAQNDKSAISKEISNSFHYANSNHCKDGYEIQNINTNDAENNSTISSSLIAEENKNIVEESSEHHNPHPVTFGKCKPEHRFPFSEDDNHFASFELDTLLKFNTHALHDDLVFEFAFSMKQRILEKINCFKDPYKDKLKLVCELTDGTQSEHNQMLINERMCDLIYDFKDEIGEKRWKTLLDEQSKNVHTQKSHDENEILHELRPNIDGQLRNAHPRRSHDEDEVVQEHSQNVSDGQLKNTHPRRSHNEDEVVHEHSQIFSDGQSKNTHLRRSHNEDEVMYEHSQNFSDEQSRNAHPRRSHHEHRRNFSGGQSKNTHPRRSHNEDEVMYEHSQHFSDGQSRNAHKRRSHNEDEVVHEQSQNFLDGHLKNTCPSRSHNEDEVMYEHSQNFSDGQSRNAHPRRSHHEHRRNFSDGQPRNAYSRRPHEVVHEHRQNFSNEHLRRSHDDEVVHEHNQNFSDGQSHDEAVYVHRQNFTDERSKKVHSRRLQYEDEIVHEHRQSFSDEQSKVQSRRVHYRDEIVQHEHRRNFSDGRSRNVHLRRSHYKDETMHQH